METPWSRFLFFFLLWFFYGHVAAGRGQMRVSEPETSSDNTVVGAVGKLVGTLWVFLILFSLCRIFDQCMPHGADKTLIRMLPFFKFSMLRGSKEGLECIICLKRFEDAETLRLLPKCGHAFHVNCIDLWLNTRAICPLCGKRVTIQDVIMFLSQRRSEFLLPISSPAPSDGVVLDVSVKRVPSAELSSSCKRPKWLRWGRQKEKREETAAHMEPVRGNDLQLLNKFLHRIIVSDVLHESSLNSAGPVSRNSVTRASESPSVLRVAKMTNTEISTEENIMPADSTNGMMNSGLSDGDSLPSGSASTPCLAGSTT